MLNRDDILRLIPHQNGMCLLDGVRSWDAEHICCIARSHRLPGNPLRTGAGLPAACGIEYAAQAVAVHGGLKTSNEPGFHAPARGYLANAKDVHWQVERLDDIEADLVIEAEQLISEGGRSIYAFRIGAAGRPLLDGRVAVVLEGSASSGAAS
jgi:predicted hotdog family 3-hydroxylacyl-ACP dehydratase